MQENISHKNKFIFPQKQVLKSPEAVCFENVSSQLLIFYSVNNIIDYYWPRYM